LGNLDTPGIFRDFSLAASERRYFTLKESWRPTAWNGIFIEKEYFKSMNSAISTLRILCGIFFFRVKDQIAFGVLRIRGVTSPFSHTSS
jgi:hypothetical protein